MNVPVIVAEVLLIALCLTLSVAYGSGWVERRLRARGKPVGFLNRRTGAIVPLLSLASLTLSLWRQVR